MIHMINLVSAVGLLFLAVSSDVTLQYATQFNCVPVHTSQLSSQQWVDKLLGGHDRRFQNEMGLCKHIFTRLVSVLGKDDGVIHTQHVLAKVQVAIFLHYAHQGLSNCALQEWFQWSEDTITKCIHCILDTLTSEKIYRAYVKLLMCSSPVPTEIRNSVDFWPYFKDCIGAIDSSHIPAFVPESMHIRFQDWKGQISQNVLAACSMNMKFLYVLPGWEGSAADSCVLEHAWSQDFMIPDGCYYLADAMLRFSL